MSLPEMNHLSAATETLLDTHGLGLADLHRTLDCVMEHQVDFADLYLQSTRQESWSMENGLVKSGSFVVDQGFGLRAINVDETAFAYSQHIDLKLLLQAARSVRSVASSGGSTRLGPQCVESRTGLYPAGNPVSAIDSEAKIALLESVDRKARALDPRVSQVMAFLELSHSTMMVARHDGRLAADLRPMVVMQFRVVAQHNGRVESSNGTIGARATFALFDDDVVDREVRRVVDSVLIKLEAGPAPSGKMPVVIGPGWPGMLLHEAMGHGFEGDFNRLGSSIYSGKLGELIANPCVNIVDDATLTGRRGSLHVDDEGELGQNTPLIVEGVLAGYMHDNLNARLMKQSPTGNGRRQSYSHLPMPRMTNTFMLPGNHTPEEIIATVKYGLYLADLGSGQVDIVSGQYTFEGELAYLIEDGRITRPVKGATLTGNGPETLKMISMVANDLELDRGGATCGKSHQNVPVCVGQPTLKIDELIVGGTGFR